MPSAVATLSTLGTVVINTGISVATTIFTTYWPYVLVFGVLLSLAIFVKRTIKMGRR
jgi:hypothetical protein